MPDTLTLPVDAASCTVNGLREAATWAGLRMDLAEPSGLPAMPYLNVPWWHADDGEFRVGAAARYRVRPRAEPGRCWRGRVVDSVAFRRGDDGAWQVVVTWRGRESHADPRV